MYSTQGQPPDGLRARSAEQGKTQRRLPRDQRPLAGLIEPGAPTRNHAPGKLLGFSLEKTLSRFGPFPSASLLLGMGEDGAPLVLDLTDAAPGSLLALGDESSSTTRLLRAMLASVIRINRPRQVEIRIIAHRPARFDDFFPSEHCQQILAADDETVSDEILALLPTTGLRSHRKAPMVILVIDDLVALTVGLSIHAFASLCWLARHGPRSGVWIIAALPKGLIDQVEPLLFDAFTTHLVSQEAHDHRQPPEFAVIPRQGQARQGDSAYLNAGETTARFWICEPG